MGTNMKKLIKCVFSKHRVPVELDFKNDTIFVHFPYHAEMVEEVRSMRGSQWHPELKMWSIDNCKRNMYAFSILSNSSSIASQYWSEEKDFPTTASFWKHQKEIYNFEMTRRRCIVGAEMRVGKTYPTFQVFYDSKHLVGYFVTTKSAYKGIFREHSKWFKGKFHLMPYSSSTAGLGKVLMVMTYNKFTSLLQEWPMGKDPVGFVVFDECQKLKNEDSARSQAAFKVSDMMEEVYSGEEYIIGLSGTPAPKNPVDWWSQCETVRSGYIREGTPKKMEWRIGRHERSGAAGEFWKLSGWNEGEVEKLAIRLRGLVKIWLLKDCIELPPKRYEVVDLEPSKEVLKVAKFIVDTEDNASSARSRLRQLSDGFQYEKEYREESNKVVRSGLTYVGSPKEEALKEDLLAHEDVGRLVVYSAFQGSTDVIRKVCLEAGWSVLQIDGRGKFLHISDKICLTDEEAIDLAFSEMDRSTDEGRIPFLVVNAQTDSAGTGLEFSASPTIIYYSNSDNGEGRMQSEARGYSANMDKVRGGLIKDYCHLPSDYLVRNNLLAKKDLQRLSMGEFKEIFSRITNEGEVL